jgi:hypothetical protein
VPLPFDYQAAMFWHFLVAGISMFRNYFNTAWRNLLRNKTFSAINISGPALGMGCSLLIFLWVQDERHIDTFNGDRDVCGVYESMYTDGVPETRNWTPPGLLARGLNRNMPEIKYASSFWNNNSETLFSVRAKNIAFKGASADTDFFKIFNYPLAQGTRASALAGADVIAISSRMAVDFFGSASAAMGKTIRYNNTGDFAITAVFDVPRDASEKFDFEPTGTTH